MIPYLFGAEKREVGVKTLSVDVKIYTILYENS
jgi:hypothetical protein